MTLDIQIHPASDVEFPVIQNLVRFYIYDMSEHMGWRCPENGIFGGCDDLIKYWNEPKNAAFLIRSNDELAGFAMVDAHPRAVDVDYCIGEFFVLRKFRRRGVGEHAAHHLFDRFRGRWIVEQLIDNAPALTFWRKVIGRYTKDQFSESITNSSWGPENVIAFRNDWP